MRRLYLGKSHTDPILEDPAAGAARSESRAQRIARVSTCTHSFGPHESHASARGQTHKHLPAFAGTQLHAHTPARPPARPCTRRAHFPPAPAFYSNWSYFLQ